MPILAGTLVYNNGDIYIGHLLDNKPHGHGFMQYAKKDKWDESVKFPGSIYIGSWLEGFRHGYGKQIYKNGDIYEGKWRYNSHKGLFKITYANGDIYQGNFDSYYKQENGKMIYANGSYYKGDWRNDKYHGYGKFCDGKKTIYGNWVRGKKVGMFTIKSVNGTDLQANTKNNTLRNGPDLQANTNVDIKYQTFSFHANLEN